MELPYDLQFPMHTHRLMIRRCEVQTRIGVHEHEQARATTLLFDLDLDVDARVAAATDRIGETVDYAAVVSDLRECLRHRRHYLVEAVAEFVAARILARFRVSRVRLSVAKVGVLEGVGSVGVEIERFQRVAPRAAPAGRPRAESLLDTAA